MTEALELIPYDTLEERVEAMYRDGFAYLPGVLNADEIAELRAQMDALTPNPESFDKNLTVEDNGFVNRHINNTFNRHPHFLNFLDYDGVVDIAEAIHGEDCHTIGMTAWMTGPGRPDQKLHIDWLPLELPPDVLADPRVRTPIFISTAHFYLDDLDDDLGPTNFILGSHLSGCKPDGAASWNGQEERFHRVQGGRRRHFPKRGLAPRHRQHQRSNPLPVAGPLCDANDHAEVSTLPEPIPVRPGHPRSSQRAAVAADG